MKDEESSGESQELVQQFLKAFPAGAPPLMSHKGLQLVEELGLDFVRDVVFDILCGVNIRDSTESLTRKRLALLNAATIVQYIQLPAPSDSLDTFIEAAAHALTQRNSPISKWLLNWALGLTDKARQNVLRDGESLEIYTQRFIETLKQAAELAKNNYGELTGTLKVGDREIKMDWLFLLYLAASIGAQTLTIRGSEKSTYGKLFEKLVLGSALSVLGFTFAPTGPANPVPGQFWLSSREKRESDATLLISPGKGVRFDIGFIGRGNSEISLDKVSRFARRAEFNRRQYDMTTVVIVDRIGTKSKLEELARDIDGVVIQMAMAYWPQTLAQRLNERFGYSGELVDAPHENVRAILGRLLEAVPLEDLLKKTLPN